MTKTLVRNLALSLTLSAFPVFAEPLYYGADVALLEYSEDGISDDASLTALNLRFGAFVNNNLSAEVRVGKGVDGEAVGVYGITYYPAGARFELDYFYGTYLRGGVPVSDRFYPYAVIGYTKAKVDGSAMGVSVSTSGSDLSFGAGADFEFSDTLKIRGEYISYVDKDGAAVGGFSVGFSKSL